MTSKHSLNYQLYFIKCIDEVDPELPGVHYTRECNRSRPSFMGHDQFFQAVTTSGCMGSLNVCDLKDLLVTNRQRLYAEACGAVMRQIVGSSTPNQDAPQDAPTMLPFEVIGVAGDGRCGWRAILASLDIAAFKSVPRTVVLKGM